MRIASRWPFLFGSDEVSRGLLKPFELLHRVHWGSQGLSRCREEVGVRVGASGLVPGESPSPSLSPLRDWDRAPNPDGREGPERAPRASICGADSESLSPVGLERTALSCAEGRKGERFGEGPPPGTGPDAQLQEKHGNETRRDKHENAFIREAPAESKGEIKARSRFLEDPRKRVKWP